MSPRFLSIAGVTLFLLFAALAFFVRAYPSFDYPAASFINNLQVGPLESLFVWASLYGREYFWVAVVGLMLVLGDRQTRMVAIGLGGLFIVGIVAGEVAKEVIARPRPGSIPLLGIIYRLPPDTDSSFPSGHALIVTIGAAYSLLTFRKKWVAGALTFEAAVVCFSRVYVGAHFPTDVLGGVLLGTAIVLLGLSLGPRLKRYSDPLSVQVSAVKDGPLKL